MEAIQLWVVNQFQGVPWWNWTLQALGLVTSYIGAELNARQKVEGFYLWIFGNIALGALHLVTGLWLLLVLDLLYLRVNIMGIGRWRQLSKT